MKTFNIRISRIVNQQNVRTYIDVEAANEVEALQRVILLMQQATADEIAYRDRDRSRERER